MVATNGSRSSYLRDPISIQIAAYCLQNVLITCKEPEALKTCSNIVLATADLPLTASQLATGQDNHFSDRPFDEIDTLIVISGSAITE